LSGCAALKDIRAAINNYSSINWGSIGAAVWHICVRDNPQIIGNLPDLTRFPLLRELLTWNDNQTGPFVCHSTVIQRINSYDNHYTSADISGCSDLREFYLSGSQLVSLNLGTANMLNDVRLKDCSLTESQTDYVLHTLDGAGQSVGYLELNGNDAAPSSNGLVHLGNLRGKGWTVTVNTGPVTGIADVRGKTEPLDIIITGSEIKIMLNNDFISWKADLYNIQGLLVSSKPVKSDICEFDISSLSSGIYIVVLSKGENKRVAKVIKP
jgi:hypothetical protein